MSSFFTAPASQKKRKRQESGAAAPRKRNTIAAKPAPAKARSRKVRDDSISDDDSDDSVASGAGEDFEGFSGSGDESSGAEDETADDRRLRLAQRYLDNIREEVNADPYAFDAADVDRDLIAERLKEDVAETKGKLHNFIAEEYDFGQSDGTYFSADQNGITAVATISPYVFTTSSDGSIAKWELASPQDDPNRPSDVAARKRPKLLKRFAPPRQPKKSYQGHEHGKPVLCIAASASGKFIATGGKDRKIVVWDPTTLKPLKAFTHHRDSVTCLSFRRGTHTLYSASADRTCKVWSLDEMGYVQTLFGHQDQVVDIAGLAGEKFVSVGARDKTARLFKVVEEQQLVFRGGGGGGRSSKKDRGLTNSADEMETEKEQIRYEEGSMDRIAAIDEDTFVTGSDNGSIALCSVLRKKPVYTVHLAHGLDPQSTLDEAYAEKETQTLLGNKRPGREKPRWITALATVPLADLVLSGSWDGHIRAWRVTKDRKRIEEVGIVGEDGSNIRHDSAQAEDAAAVDSITESRGAARGIVNGISVFARGEKGKDGLCIIAAVSKNHRLGDWHGVKGKGWKNGAVVFEVTKSSPVLANGIHDAENGDGGEDGDMGE